MLFIMVTLSDTTRSSVVPPAGFEPALPPPEGGALSPELRGPCVDNPSARLVRTAGAPRRAVIVDGGCTWLIRQQCGSAERDHQQRTRADSDHCAACRREPPEKQQRAGVGVTPGVGPARPARQVRRREKVCESGASLDVAALRLGCRTPSRGVAPRTAGVVAAQDVRRRGRRTAPAG